MLFINRLVDTFKFQSHRSLVMIQYCGEPPWPRGTVLDLKPPALEFRIMCLEGSIISMILSSSWGYPGPVA